MIAKVALGSSEPLSFYQGFQYNTTETLDEDLSVIDHPSSSANDLDQQADPHPSEQTITERPLAERLLEATALLDEFASHSKSIIQNDISESCLKTLRTLVAKVKHCSTESALEAMLVGRNPILNRQTASRVIKVQPTSISRRKKANGSNNAQKRGGSISLRLAEQRRERKNRTISRLPLPTMHQTQRSIN
uniref:Uncharacterized protein n=1 Tax=Spongospora subterranea TaxID=70186 RepID=A0A0H5QTA5_9EUKA|eukprot:CRZ04776.1 hypothetical protein [Spongospora subterranea]